MPSVLIVDDLSAIHEMLAAVIQPTGYETFFALNGEEALEKYKASPTDVVLADISMEPMDGISLLQNLKTFDPNCIVILMTGYASTETAMKALKFGAFDYIQKPFKIDELLQTLKRAMELSRARGREGGNQPDPESGAKLEAGFVGQSRRIQQLRQQAVRMMAGRAPILLHGEKGTGKRALAELIHEEGEGDGRLVAIDCAQKEESELIAGFGEEGKGAETWFEQAKEGTLLLENVDVLTRKAQAKLVQAVKRIVDTRIVCSTAADLERLVEEGEFDDELFYRIAALPIRLPSLREYLEDLPELIAHFSEKARHPRFEAAQIEFGSDAIDLMKRYSWPGNVSELARLVISIASNTEERVIGPDQLPIKLTGPERLPNLEDYLARKKKSYLAQVLLACEGDRAKAAEILECDPAEFGEEDDPA